MPSTLPCDTSSGTSAVAPGARIDVGGLAYVIDQATVIDKTDLPGNRSLWADESGRLVVITCLQKPDHTPSSANFVITAHLT